jgi:hypothetical protein
MVSRPVSWGRGCRGVDAQMGLASFMSRVTSDTPPGPSRRCRQANAIISVPRAAARDGVVSLGLFDFVFALGDFGVAHGRADDRVAGGGFGQEV